MYNRGLKTLPWGRLLWAILVSSISSNLQCTDLSDIKLFMNPRILGGIFNFISFYIRMEGITLSYAAWISKKEANVHESERKPNWIFVWRTARLSMQPFPRLKPNCEFGNSYCVREIKRPYLLSFFLEFYECMKSMR